MTPTLLLASASPRRKELLAQAGFSFEVRPSLVPEEYRVGEDPIAFATRLAREKAQAVFAVEMEKNSSQIILGADTIVLVEGEILGKPSDAVDAARMLRLLSGRTHHVITGVCLVSEVATESASEVTGVTFTTLSDAEIEAYIASGEPMDKAGAYGIQGRAAKWIPRIQGCYFNVVGLPLALVANMVEGMNSRMKRIAPSPAR
jgi:nucleoside triphosphate pyrophosphatase